jgi:hypothetical protein
LADRAAIAYINLDSFVGYDSRHRLAELDGAFKVEGSADWKTLGEAVAVGNRLALDVNGRAWPANVRRLGDGDLIKLVDDTGKLRLLCPARTGWVRVNWPGNVVLMTRDNMQPHVPFNPRED